jgi:hypothetical protein
METKEFLLHVLNRTFPRDVKFWGDVPPVQGVRPLRILAFQAFLRDHHSGLGFGRTCISPGCLNTPTSLLCVVCDTRHYCSYHSIGLCDWRATHQCFWMACPLRSHPGKYCSTAIERMCSEPSCTEEKTWGMISRAKYCSQHVRCAVCGVHYNGHGCVFCIHCWRAVCHRCCVERRSGNAICIECDGMRSCPSCRSIMREDLQQCAGNCGLNVCSVCIYCNACNCIYRCQTCSRYPCGPPCRRCGLFQCDSCIRGDELCFDCAVST